MKNKLFKSLRRAVVLLILLILSYMVWAFWGGDNERRVNYRTDRITRGSITNVVTASGTLNPVDLVNVGTQVSGQVDKVHVAVNDRVEKGQLLAEIDPSLLAAQVTQDESSLNTARFNSEQAARDLKRSRLLLEKDYIAQADVEHAEQTWIQAKNAWDSARIQLERDKVNLNYAKIYAPIDGIVISQDVTLGQTVAASYQTPNMFKIAGDLTKMKIDVNMSESDIGKVTKGLKGTFIVDAFPERQFSGVVQMVNLNPNNQQGVVTYTVVLTLDNPDRVLLPGMTAYVSINLTEKKDVLRVPASALRFTLPPKPVSGLNRLFQSQSGIRASSTILPAIDGRKTIYVLRDGIPQPVPVTTGVSDDSFVEISGDHIAEGDTVVIGVMPSGKHGYAGN